MAENTNRNTLDLWLFSRKFPFALFFVATCFLYFMYELLAVQGAIAGKLLQREQYPFLLLIGIIRIPSIEFLPRITERQKYLTIGRVLLSNPILILWQQTGTWH